VSRLTAYLHLFGIVGLSITQYYSWFLPLLIILLLSSLVISFIKAGKQRDYRTLTLSVIGSAAVLAGKTWISLQWLTTAGLILLFINLLAQVALSRKTCSRNITALFFHRKNNYT